MIKLDNLDEVATPTALRKVSQFFGAHIIDVSHRVLADDPAVRAAADPTLVTLQIRRSGKTIAAINSEAATQLAAAAKMFGEADSAVVLTNETKLLKHLAVAPRHRGHGHAHRLMQETERRHIADGVRVWFGQVDVRERDAVTFYERMGFQITSHADELPGAASLASRVISIRTGIWIYKQF